MCITCLSCDHSPKAGCRQSHWDDQPTASGDHSWSSNEIYVTRCPVSLRPYSGYIPHSIIPFSHSLRYRFHQNTDLFYLTGLQEPDCVLLLESSPSSPLPHHTSTLYVRPRNPVRYLSPSQSPHLCHAPLLPPPLPLLQGAVGWTSSRATWNSGVHRSGPGTGS